jgi:hypothetical protein
MHATDLFFVIPTDRLREVGETVPGYDEHFPRRSGRKRERLLSYLNQRLPDNRLNTNQGDGHVG